MQNTTQARRKSLTDAWKRNQGH